MGDGRFARHEIFVATAVVGAHANAGPKGFRQRDVKFLIELFSNWVECALRFHVLPVQNTQVLRYIEGLVGEGYARRIARRSHPYYRLTRTGLIQLLARLIDREGEVHREEFFFLYYFIKNYKPRLEALVKSEGKQFPHALKAELDGLLDTDALVRGEIKEAEKELVKLDKRMADAAATSAYVARKVSEGVPLTQVVDEVEELYPYDLNSQRPISELIASIPEDSRLWELQVGNTKRTEEIWKPCRALLEAYLRELRALAGS